MPYVLHWSSLELFESLEEVKRSILAAQAVKQRDEVTAQATVCNREEGQSHSSKYWFNNLEC